MSDSVHGAEVIDYLFAYSCVDVHVSLSRKKPLAGRLRSLTAIALFAPSVARLLVL